MGNALPQGLSDGQGKVILSDGTIHQYDKPLTVAELMLEYPQQVVVEFNQQTAICGKKPAPLPADKKLEMSKVYLMLPVKRGKPAALSSEEARRLLMIANTILKSKTLASFTGFVPLFTRMCSAGAQGPNQFATQPKIKRNMDADDHQEAADMTKITDPFAEILEGRPEFLSRQLSGKGWKPSLDTITEKNVKTKVRHWLFNNKFVLP